jgi:hypothetical protein
MTTTYRKIPMVRVPHAAAPTREIKRQCVVCGLRMKGAPRYWVHVVDGGANVVHVDDGCALSQDPAAEAGDMGLHEVGPDCAKRFPREFVHDRKGWDLPARLRE